MPLSKDCQECGAKSGYIRHSPDCKSKRLGDKKSCATVSETVTPGIVLSILEDVGVVAGQFNSIGISLTDTPAGGVACIRYFEGEEDK